MSYPKYHEGDKVIFTIDNMVKHGVIKRQSPSTEFYLDNIFYDIVGDWNGQKCLYRDVIEKAITKEEE